MPDNDLPDSLDHIRTALATQLQMEDFASAFDDLIQLLKETKESTRRASQAKSAFLANMSHELRTPLNAIMGFAEMLRGTQLDEQQTDYVQVILDSGRRLLTYINEILELTNLEMGKITPQKVACDIPAILEEVWKEHLPKLTAKGLDGHIELQPLPQKLELDGQLLGRVISIILDNAIKFTETGSVSLLFSHEVINQGKLKLSFEIADTGIGIPPEQLRKIFDLFEQADIGPSRRYGGLGLGLGLAQRMAKLMGGRIEVESWENQGSLFRFILMPGDAPQFYT